MRHSSWRTDSSHPGRSACANSQVRIAESGAATPTDAAEHPVRPIPCILCHPAHDGQPVFDRMREKTIHGGAILLRMKF